MGLVTTTLDLETLVSVLYEVKTLPETTSIDEEDDNHDSISALSGYAFENIFLPIIRDECIPVAKIDFGKVSYADIEKLVDALNNCKALMMFDIGDAFAEMRPAVSKQSIFI